MYDVIVIGTGTAGQTAAGILAAAGKKVAVVDNRAYGGTCALRGCQPKKFLVSNTHAAAETRALTGRGYKSPAVTDWRQLQAFKHEFTDPVTENTRKALGKKSVDLYDGTASFTDEKSIELKPSGSILTADNFIIAAGSYPLRPEFGSSIVPHASDDFLELEKLPASMIFIGGGYISLEFAFIAALAGSSVTILQRGDRFLKTMPESLLEPVKKSAADHGIRMITGVDVTGVTEAGQSCRVSTSGHGGFEAEYVLAATGRAPAIDDLNLDAAGVRRDKRGIITDRYMRTSAGRIYAAGDCVSSIMLAPVADMEAAAAAANIIEENSLSVDYHSVPSVVFTYPQMASVGLTRQEAEDEGYKPLEKKGSGAGWPNYRRINAKHMYYETVADSESGRLLGAHITSPYAGELINLFAYAIRSGHSASGLKDLPWAYPTYTSDIKYMV